MYKKAQLEASLSKHKPPSRPPKPVFFLHANQPDLMKNKHDHDLAQAVSHDDLKIFIDDQLYIHDPLSAAAENQPS